MRTFCVTLSLIVNPSRDLGMDKPETKDVDFIVKADEPRDAIPMAKDMDKSGLSVWESFCEEITEEVH